MKELDDVLLVGRHPTRDVDMLVLGSNGSDTAWAMAAELAVLYLDRPEARFATPPGLVVVDIRRDTCYAVHHLRRVRS